MDQTFEQLTYAVIGQGEVVANYRVDLLVEGSLIVEAKTKEQTEPKDIKQTWNFLRCTDLEVALLMNFGPQKLDVRRYTMLNEHKKHDAKRTKETARPGR